MAESKEGVFDGIIRLFWTLVFIVLAPFLFLAQCIYEEMEIVPSNFTEWVASSDNIFFRRKPEHLKDFELLKALANSGDSEAQYWLAEAYVNGEGVLKNYEDAFNFYYSSATAGNLLAAYKTGVAFCSGRGTPIDHINGFSMLSKASRISPEAAIAVGRLYELGYCSSKTEAAGVIYPNLYFNQAVDLGGIEYVKTIGDIYASGKGLPRDKEKAEEWYRIGANQGLSDIQLTLGFFLAANTNGDTEKMIPAYAWLTIGLLDKDSMTPYQVDSIQDRLQGLESDMTSEQVSKAQTLAKNCVVTQFQDCSI